MRSIVALSLALLAAVPAPAQDLPGQEILVTGSRIGEDDDDGAIPAVGLRRAADYAVQQVKVAGDTRDEKKRRDEIYEMIRNAIALAARRPGIELATGEVIVEPLTLANYRNLPLANDGRPDTDRAAFLVKTRLAPGIDAKAALDRIAAFVKDVPTVGRAQMETTDDLSLSVVSPNQYRNAVADLVAADAKAMAAKLGPDYAVELKGLDRPVQWSRATLTEVFLYVPYSYAIVPARR